jgi:uncharacterized membrane protein YjjP (DUF1212 family)
VLAWFEVDCFGVRPVIVKLQIKPGIMETPPLNFQQSLRKILTVVLYVSLALAVLGVLLKMRQQSYSDSILMVSLSAMAGMLLLINGDNWVVLKKAFITGVAVVLVGGYFIIKYGFTFN